MHSDQRHPAFEVKSPERVALEIYHLHTGFAWCSKLVWRAVRPDFQLVQPIAGSNRSLIM